jgi:hypothetical protein
MVRNQIVQPSLHKGWHIFASRPISLVVALIFAVVICVISFFLLTFPVIAGYYYAVSQSKREEFFIDLGNVFRTTFLVLSGVRKYFFQSYVLGLFGLVPPIVLLLIPVLAVEQGSSLSIVLQVLWLPALFLAGAVVLFGYPYLLATNQGFGALGHAVSMGKAKPVLVFGVGVLILFPIPGAIFHLLMVFSYPILAASAVASTADATERLLEIFEREERKKRGLGFYVVVLAIVFGGCYFFEQLWGGPGILFWLGLCLAFFLMSKMTAFSFAVRVFVFVVGFVAALFGGGTLLARALGDTAFMVWTVICIIFLMMFQRRIFGQGYEVKRRQTK